MLEQEFECFIDNFHILEVSHDLLQESGILLGKARVQDAHGCRWGKKGSKHFTIFVGWVSDETRVAFKPQLSHESLAADWVDVHEIAKAKDVHPRLEMLFEGHYKQEVEGILKFKI